MTLRDALQKKEILVVTGSGGVGKTSVAAALALAGARADRRSIVLTIDPAKRLASALGIAAGLGHEASAVEVQGAPGTLHAAMLDMKTAWDDLIERYSPDAETARNIKTNRLYQSLSEHFVGSQGYMAMESLADLHEGGAYDLIVIDTPPTRHALDFLDAPKRMTDFIGGSLLRWFAKPYTSAGKFGMKAFNFTASPFLKVADRVLGSQVLEDLSDFVINFQKLYDDFKDRAADVLELLHRPETGFVVVTTLEGPPLGEAKFFIDRLVDEGLPMAGVIANKVIPERFASQDARDAQHRLDALDADTAASVTGVDAGAARDVLDEMRTALATLVDLAGRDVRQLEELTRRARSPVGTVPLLPLDVHDVATLDTLGSHIFDADG